MSGVQQAVFQNQRSFGAPPDAQFNYVTMLLHGDGTNGAQNNTFVDSSTNAFTITRNGNTTQGSFSPYGSNWGNYFGGSDYLSLADNANLNPSTQDFVMEAWVFLTGTTGNNQGINGKGTAGTDGYTLFVTNALVLSFAWNGTGGATITGGTLVLNTWNHVAVVRNSSVIRLYLNGVGAGSSTACTTDITSTATKFVGQARGGNPILGYMSNYRMTKGSLPSGYDATSASLTPPTAPLTAISGTSLLTCQSNRFVDNSASPLTITTTGTPSVQRFNPFGASTAYSTSVIGGSGYFDGSGDYLSGPTNNSAFQFGTGDFTVEAWVYQTVDNTYPSILEIGDHLSATGILFIKYGTSSAIYSGGFYGASATTMNGWNHIAYVRSSGSLKIYVNGVSPAGVAFTNNLTNSNKVTIGTDQNLSAGYYFSGNISNLRVVKGTAVYTANFTPPTAPLTAVTNTQLLLLTTNGAIFDNAMMNDLETVGNAQISTSVYKYGTGSMSFDGTGDYLSTLSTPNLAFGSGDFTIECWVYASSLGSYNAVFAQFPINGGSASNSYTLETVGSNMEFYYCSGTTLYGPTTLGTITTGVWIHYAICRSGSTLYPFKNGVLGTTTSITQTLNSPTSAITVGGEVAGGGYWNGYIDDLRITKGYARYTANFTPPTAAFPNTGPY